MNNYTLRKKKKLTFVGSKKKMSVLKKKKNNLTSRYTIKINLKYSKRILKEKKSRCRMNRTYVRGQFRRILDFDSPNIRIEFPVQILSYQKGFV